MNTPTAIVIPAASIIVFNGSPSEVSLDVVGGVSDIVTFIADIELTSNFKSVKYDDSPSVVMLLLTKGPL
jgi:hypothetical protein